MNEKNELQMLEFLEESQIYPKGSEILFTNQGAESPFYDCTWFKMATIQYPGPKKWKGLNMDQTKTIGSRFDKSTIIKVNYANP